MRPRRSVNYVLCFIAGIALVAAGYAIAAGGKTGGDKNPIYSIRPTGVGLPRLDMHGTVGAGDLPAALESYHDSGEYESDLESVGTRAQGYLDRRVPRIRKEAGKSCKANGVKNCPKPKLAIVLDVDETTLSNYPYLANADFSNVVGALASALLAADAPPIEPTLDLVEDAQDLGVDVFFITGRPELQVIRNATEANLSAAGYSGWKDLILNPGNAGSTVPYKSGAREAITDDGYIIVVNLGDQDSDLKGGYAERAFKYPNPYYFIGD